MPKRREVVAEQLRELADDLDDLWKALTRDPAAEKRKERAWTLLTGAIGAAATMASRRAVTKLWPILTGEQPLMPRAPTKPPQRETQEREETGTVPRT